MRYCKNCGLLAPRDAAACPECGALLPPEAPQSQADQTAQTEAAPQPATPIYTADAPPPSPAPRANGTNGQDLTTGGYLINLILFELPLVGFILQLVFAFGGSQTPATRKLATAYLLRTAIHLALGLLLILLTAVLTWAIFTTVDMPPEMYYTW